MADTVETTVYLVLEPTYTRYSFDPSTPSGMKVKRMLQSKPKQHGGVCIAVKLRLPAAAFKPLEPVVTIDIPPEAIDYDPIVEVVIPSDDD